MSLGNAPRLASRTLNRRRYGKSWDFGTCDYRCDWTVLVRVKNISLVGSHNAVLGDSMSIVGAACGCQTCLRAAVELEMHMSFSCLSCWVSVRPTEHPQAAGCALRVTRDISIYFEMAVSCYVFLFSPVDIIWAIAIVWRITGKVIRSVLYCVVYDSCTQ